MSTPFLDADFILQPAPPNTPDVTYSGNCHCGAVKFTLTLPDIRRGTIMRCNCSICTKKGYQSVYPKRSEVTFVSGFEGMKTYRFGGLESPLYNCRVALNISTFTDIDELLSELTYVTGNGKHALGSPYKVPE
ncbi:hypothetical protein PT974_09448 [Cladobotryum mycophilum]|uniref:CENP-V/GFA domain-containing protein n=1 Tax=Cladobotryum mycophilum TaxID=491253 RepID=A0ABR0SHC8_9HYPO